MTIHDPCEHWGRRWRPLPRLGPQPSGRQWPCHALVCCMVSHQMSGNLKHANIRSLIPLQWLLEKKVWGLKQQTNIMCCFWFSDGLGVVVMSVFEARIIWCICVPGSLISKADCYSLLRYIWKIPMFWIEFDWRCEDTRQTSDPPKQHLHRDHDHLEHDTNNTLWTKLLVECRPFLWNSISLMQIP